MAKRDGATPHQLNAESVQEVLNRLKAFSNKLAVDDGTSASFSSTASSSASDQASPTADRPSSIIQTPTTRSNLERILASATNPKPLLLCGDTGVGKSALIEEAANANGTRLIRFNMSSKVTIDDLLGKVVLKQTHQGMAAELQHGLFTTAYDANNSGGCWLLLDELNLASEAVLQAIELALDNDSFQLRNPCDSKHSSVTINKGANFRLFATQNPNTGFFRGMREQFTPSFLSRFSSFSFASLPRDEWEIVVAKTFKRAGHPQNQGYARRLVDFHMTAIDKFGPQAIIRKYKKFEDPCLASITIRDLLKVVRQLCKQGAQSSPLEPQLAWEAWCVYGARFSSSQVRNRVSRAIKTHLWTNFELDRVLTPHGPLHTSESSTQGMGITLPTPPPSNLLDELREAAESDVQRLMPGLVSFHQELKIFLRHPDFYERAGLYAIEPKWAKQCLDDFQQEPRSPANLFPAFVAAHYSTRFRATAASTEIDRLCVKEFKISLATLNLQKSELMTSEQFLQRARNPELPFALTTRVLRLWKVAASALVTYQPILVTGDESSGKSEALRILSTLAGQRLSTVCLTPETEPSALVGQLLPSRNRHGKDESPVVWHAGAITASVESGSWVLLDNLNQADACVLERLNPVLENPPVWVVTENAESARMEIDESFRILATMTPGKASISPALANRCTILALEPIDESLPQELAAYASAVLGTPAPSDIELAVDLCLLVRERLLSHGRPFHLRSLIRMLDCAHRFHIDFRHSTQDPTLRSALLAASNVCFISQLQTTDSKDFGASLKADLKAFLNNPVELEFLGFSFRVLDPINIQTASSRTDN